MGKELARNERTSLCVLSVKNYTMDLVNWEQKGEKSQYLILVKFYRCNLCALFFSFLNRTLAKQICISFTTFLQVF